MSKERIETGKAPEVAIRCQGDLRIRGWAESTVLTQGEECQTTENEDGLNIEAGGDLTLMVPVKSFVKISEVAGDLAIKNVDGDIEVSTAHGDVVLNNLGRVDVQIVQGNLAVRNLSGSLAAQGVSGDATFRNLADMLVGSIYGDLAAGYVNGTVQVDSVMGDISLRTVNGDVTVAEGHRDLNARNLGGLSTAQQIRGDVRLYGGLSAGKHVFNADGDIVVRWPADEPLNVQATASQIRNRLQLEQIVETETTLSGRIDEGQTDLILNAAGRIILKEAQAPSESWKDFETSEFVMEMEYEDLGTQITDEISSRMKEFARQMEQKFGRDFAAKIEARAQKAAVKAEKAADKAVRQAAKAARKARWQSTQWSRKEPTEPKSGSERKATEEEQMKILRMVEKGIISPDEANTLLEALEG